MAAVRMEITITSDRGDEGIAGFDGVENGDGGGLGAAGDIARDHQRGAEIPHGTGETRAP